MLPRPLSPEDAVRVRQVFAAQARGNIPDAIRTGAALHGTLLLGPLLADLYLGRHHRSTPAELTGWLARYHDQPDAPAIYALLLQKLPKNASPPPRPDAAPLPRPSADSLPADDGLRNEIDRDPVLDRNIMDRAAHGSASLALRQIAARKGLPLGYVALLKSEIAQQLFLRNEDAAALDLVCDALGVTPPDARPALGFYVGALAAWRLERFDVARAMFESAARTPNVSARLRAAAAFWASRAARRDHDDTASVAWLNTAAEQPLTMHGLLARRVLRMDIDSQSDRQVPGQADIDAVAATPAGQRAFALLQVGQPDRAERELRGLWPAAQKDPVFGRSLVMTAASAGMTELAAQLADLLQPHDGTASALPRLMLPRLRPAGGFRVDPPLIYALARIESNFDPAAVSAAGARGLMQIMPETAQYITGSPHQAKRLHEPAANLAIGQRYLASLADVDGIGDDLIRILASYNAGPGSVLRWLTDIRGNDDPLMFIEAIPVAETRAFVPQALTYAWLYAAQMHLPSPSLEALAAGEFPRFTPESQTRRIAGLTPSD
ncbi:MAG TPA: lytic transglycosylase domain-containing protein [Rhodopila sp.]|nr:lytic transglycosylase domain-containing protein [Rhodopila sp.]